ncbi:hypothetical protein [Burkholderia pseudomallei]|uniref:hypothetical protein n=1 Tax=Burkholderia pseudomallei TaxID=28450 RepID=UPI003F65E5E5
MSHQQPMSRDEVLRAFAVEENSGRDTLVRYLAAYPQYAHDLVDLSRELARAWVDEELFEEDERSVDIAVARFRAGGGLKGAVVTLKPQVFTAAAARLQLPLQAMLAFRERRVDLASVPARFLERLALALQTTLDQLSAFLSQPTLVSAARQSKSNAKPTAAAKVSFEKILLDAGVPQERVQELTERGE